MRLPKRVTVCEVGTRAGLSRIEGTSFVSPKAVPQLGRPLPGQIVKAGKWSRRHPLPDGVPSRRGAR